MSAEQRFWNWFVDHSNSYATLNTLTDEVQKEALLDAFLTELHKYAEGLYFAIGGYPGEPQELIITAEGDRAYFDKVEQLVAAAPAIPGWTLIPFKQPSEDLVQTTYEGVHLEPSSMWFMPLSNDRDPTALGLIVYLDNFTKRQSAVFHAGVYQVLDTLLGEKAAAEQINHIEVDKLPENPEKMGLIELADLSKYIAWNSRKLEE